MNDVIGLLRTLEPGGFIRLKRVVHCAGCGKFTRKSWPSWASFVAACDEKCKERADDKLTLELERGGI